MEPESRRRVASFPWRDLRARLEGLMAQGDVGFESASRAFVSAAGTHRLVLPFVLGTAHAERPGDYLEHLPERLGLCALVLIQAGASGLGLWRDDELLAHKAIKKYVVRGRGRAQPLHLKSKGKSRYGSRLRLQNAIRQLEETNEKLQQWTREHGAFERVFYSCPVRTWPELFRVTPPPPFGQRGEAEKIPFDVHPPDFAEVRRIWHALTHGREVVEEPLSE